MASNHPRGSPPKESGADIARTPSESTASTSQLPKRGRPSHADVQSGLSRRIDSLEGQLSEIKEHLDLLIALNRGPTETRIDPAGVPAGQRPRAAVSDNTILPSIERNVHLPPQLGSRPASEPTRFPSPSYQGPPLDTTQGRIYSETPLRLLPPRKTELTEKIKPLDNRTDPTFLQ